LTASGASAGECSSFLCTNRYGRRRSGNKARSLADEHFGRPDANERRALLRMDLDGLDIDDTTIEHLVRVTGGTNSLGYTFSDIRTRLLPAALAAAFPDRALTAEDLVGGRPSRSLRRRRSRVTRPDCGAALFPASLRPSARSATAAGR